MIVIRLEMDVDVNAEGAVWDPRPKLGAYAWRERERVRGKNTGKES